MGQTNMPELREIFETIRALSEEEIFKAVSQEEIEKRHKDYEELRQKEEERIRKEREEEVKALGMTQVYKKVMKLVPRVQELVQEYRNDQANWIGNYSKFDSYGENPLRLSFNIKIYANMMPDWARKRVDEEGLWEGFNSYWWDYLGQQLEGFVEGLKEDYKFIDDWGVEGRSGGWLNLDVDVPINDDVITVIDVFSADPEADEDFWFTKDGMKHAYEILKSAEHDLRKRVTAYQEIADKVEKGRKAVEKDSGSDEFWNDFFEIYGEKEEPKKAKAKKRK